jgi:hypothetical protein
MNYLRLFSVLAVITAYSITAQADQRRALRAVIRGASTCDQFLDTARKVTKATRHDQKVQAGLLTYIPGLGRVRIEFSKRRRQETIPRLDLGDRSLADSGNIVLLKGWAHSSGAVEPASGAIYTVSGTPYLFVSLSGTRALRSNNHLY